MSPLKTIFSGLPQGQVTDTQNMRVAFGVVVVDLEVKGAMCKVIQIGL